MIPTCLLDVDLAASTTEHDLRIRRKMVDSICFQLIYWWFGRLAIMVMFWLQDRLEVYEGEDLSGTSQCPRLAIGYDHRMSITRHSMSSQSTKGLTLIQKPTHLDLYTL